MTEIKIVNSTSETVFQIPDKKMELVKMLLWEVCEGAEGRPTS